MEGLGFVFLVFSIAVAYYAPIGVWIFLLCSSFVTFGISWIVHSSNLGQNIKEIVHVCCMIIFYLCALATYAAGAMYVYAALERLYLQAS